MTEEVLKKAIELNRKLNELKRVKDEISAGGSNNLTYYCRVTGKHLICENYIHAIIEKQHEVIVKDIDEEIRKLQEEIKEL